MALFKPGIGGLFAASSFIGATSSNAKATLGLTINQGAADDEILSLKSSDVSHGMTSLTEDDTFAAFKKASPTAGGLRIDGIAEAGASGVLIVANRSDDDTTKSTGAGACLFVNATKKTGTTVGAIGANANIAVFANDSTVRQILDGDGDSHQDVGTAWTNF